MSYELGILCKDSDFFDLYVVMCMFFYCIYRKTINTFGQMKFFLLLCKLK